MIAQPENRPEPRTGARRRSRVQAAEELATYARQRDGWMRAGLQGRWVTLCGPETFGFFLTQSEAYAKSLVHFADRTFVLMQVRPSGKGSSDLLPLRAASPAAAPEPRASPANA